MAQPDDAGIHNNLGVDLQEQGRLEEAAASFRRAVSANPSSPYFHYNLGSVLTALAQPADAIAAYGQALGLKPDFAEARNNVRWLAGVLEDAGRWEEAAVGYATLLSIDERPELRARFALCVRQALFTRDPPELKRLVARALTEAWARPADLALAAARLLRIGPGLRDDPLLVALLESAPVTDIVMERYLAGERRALLDAASAADAQGAPEPTPFHHALAAQCFLNEHVFAREGEEDTRAEALRERVEAALEAGEGVPALWLLAVAAYGPLSSLRSVSRLEPHMRAGRLHALWRQSVAEPLAEWVLRDSMPRLTAIGAGISSAVREQYEENPYPRWTRVPEPAAAIALADFLRDRFPAAAGHAPAPGAGVDILVAGCGTGREAIELARQFAGARVLAIDLSKASLAYAQRKARELGVAGLEFSQADILALGAVDRSFDVVSSMGVLHHLEDPAAGLHALAARLRPGGVAFLGLYSEAARGAVIAAREFIRARGYRPAPADIRRCRVDLAALDASDPARQVTAFADFFTTSECRDLLFHVQEHRFTLPQVRDLLRGAGLAFSGFVLDPPLLARFVRRFPEEGAGLDLGHWAAFEAEHPAAFAGMYVFAARKPAWPD